MGALMIETYHEQVKQKISKNRGEHSVTYSIDNLFVVVVLIGSTI